MRETDPQGFFSRRPDLKNSPNEWRLEICKKLSHLGIVLFGIRDVTSGRWPSLTVIRTTEERIAIAHAIGNQYMLEIEHQRGVYKSYFRRSLHFFFLNPHRSDS